MDTYCDMVTLLLTFFAVLLSMSSVNEEKFNAFIRALKMDPDNVLTQMVGEGTTGKNDDYTSMPTYDADADPNMDQLFEYLQEYVESSGQGDAVNISQGEDGVIYIRFSSSIFFEPNRSVLKKESLPTLTFISEGLKQYESQIRMVNICGYTAQSPNSNNNDISEWMLSGERAARVAIFMQEQMNFDGEKMVLVGYGQNYPVADNATAEGREKNRRVEMVIIGKDSQMNFDIHDALGGSVYEEDKYPTEGGLNDLLFPEEDEAGQPDAGTPDAGTPDAGTPDTGSPDANDTNSPPEPGVDANVSPYE